MKLNIIVGLLLIIQGIWMIVDKSIGYGSLINKKADGIELYIYTVPLIMLGLYMIYYTIKNRKS